VKNPAAMRKQPTPDADSAGKPTNAEPAAAGAPISSADPLYTAPSTGTPTDDNTAPSLVWPPVDEELNDWEVLNFQGAGQTPNDPMLPPSAGGEPYAPPAPIDDPAGDTSLLPLSDFALPETELIEPLTIQPTAVTPSRSGPRPSAKPTAAPDDRTVFIARPASLTPKSEQPTMVSTAPPPSSPPRSPDDTNPSGVTRVLVAPAFAASVGHAPTVPVSALHRAAAAPPASGPRRPMEDTLPAGVIGRDVMGRASDDTAVPASSHGDTHPVPILGSSAAARRVPAGPTGPASPFSRVPSRGSHAASDSDPAYAPTATQPLAFGSRGSQATPDTSMPATPLAATPIAPSPSLPVAEPVSHDSQIPTRPAPTSTRTSLLSLAAGVVVLLLVALGVYQVLAMRSTSAGAPALATLAVESTPAGATVTIDGTPRGKTPLRLELSEGSHTLDVSLAGATRHVPLTLAGSTVTAHSFEFAAPVAPTLADAAIEIRSEPAGGRVTVDGVARGITPIVVTGLTAGRHQVQVAGPFRTVTRTVTLGARQQALLVVTPARTAATPELAASDRERPALSDRERPARASEVGYVTIQSPIVLRVVRNGDFVGTSEDSRLSLPTGHQVIGLENESVGFRDVRTVEVVGGKVTPVTVSLPNGEISINARPWAEVFVDGSRVGETPVSQLTLPIGIHEVVFRHPDHGERRVSVVVKIGATGRAFTDFTK